MSSVVGHRGGQCFTKTSHSSTHISCRHSTGSSSEMLPILCPSDITRGYLCGVNTPSPCPCGFPPGSPVLPQLKKKKKQLFNLDNKRLENKIPAQISLFCSYTVMYVNLGCCLSGISCFAHCQYHGLSNILMKTDIIFIQL